MTKITSKDIKHISKLANLPLSDEEIKKYSEQLGNIISYVDELKLVDVKDVEPTSQTTGLTNVKREDKLTSDELTQKQALSGTKNTHNGYFKVPGVIINRTE